MSSKKQEIESFRQKLKERNADSNYSNQFLYGVLIEQAKWLIKREISSGRIYSNSSFFQTLRCQEIIEVPAVECCDIKTNCKLYRTKHKIPDMWIDNSGPIIQFVTSIDDSTKFFLTTIGTWASKQIDPYQKMSKIKYSFVMDGYLWFPENNPGFVNIRGFYIDDINLLPPYYCSCKDDKKKECIRFLDTKFLIPDWLEAEMFAKALQQISFTVKLPEDEQIDKNTNRKN